MIAKTTCRTAITHATLRGDRPSVAGRPSGRRRGRIVLAAAVAVGLLCPQGNSPLAATCHPIANMDPAYLPTLAADLVYETVGGQPQAVDVWHPAGGQIVGALLELHGGGDVSGDKANVSAEAQLLSYNTGLAVLNANYPLTTTPADPGTALNPFPVAISAIRCLVRWARANAQALAIDPAHIGILGRSAGGFIGTTAALVPDNAPAFDSPDCPYGPPISASFASVLSFYGGYDLTIPGANALNPKYYLAGQNGNQSVALAASPRAYVNANSPPVFLARGTLDTVIPFNQEQAMHDTLDAMGTPYVWYNVPGLLHAFSPMMGAFQSSGYNITCYMLTFIASTIGGPGPALR